MTNNLLQKQGYDCDTPLYQDNTSEILLETNRREISSKMTRRIIITFYFIKDHIIRKELNLKQCSTDDTLEKFPRKPLQGIKFNKFKKQIMGMNK